MNYLSDHISNLVKINALICLYDTGEYIKLKNHLCLLAEVDDYSTGTMADAETDEARRQLNERTWNRKPIFLCSFFIDGQMLRLLFCEHEVEAVR